MSSAASAGNEPRQAPIQVLFWVLLVVASTAAGAVSAVAGALAVIAVAGVGALLAVGIGPSAWAVGSFLVVRGVSDTFAAVPVAGPLNAGALLGMLVIAAAGLRVLVEPPSRTVLLCVGLAVFVLFWAAFGVIQYDVHVSLVREFVRATSIVAIALIAARGAHAMTPARIATVVVLAAMLPALLIIADGVQHWQAMVSEGFRPRGAMSHPNAAAILFGVALPLAVWHISQGRKEYFAAAGLLSVAIMFTQSLGGLAQTLSALFAMAVLTPSVRAGYRGALGFAVFVTVILFVTDPFGLSRVAEVNQAALTSTDVEDGSFAWRLANWSALLEYWREAPILGHGLGMTASLIRPLNHLPHSDVLRLLVETGIVGLGVFAIGYLLVWQRLLVLIVRSEERAQRTFAAATAAVLAGVTVHALVTHVSYNTAPMYVLTALIAWTVALRVRASD